MLHNIILTALGTEHDLIRLDFKMAKHKNIEIFMTDNYHLIYTN